MSNREQHKPGTSPELANRSNVVRSAANKVAEVMGAHQLSEGAPLAPAAVGQLGAMSREAAMGAEDATRIERTFTLPGAQVFRDAIAAIGR